MSDKFKDVPLEADTRLLVNGLRSVGEYEALFQQWYWDGFLGKLLNNIFGFWARNSNNCYTRNTRTS